MSVTARRSLVAISVMVALCAAAGTAQQDGLYQPLPIDPTVEIGNARWLLDLYLTVFERSADDAGFRTNFGDLEAGTQNQASMYNAFVGSAEFQSNIAVLGDKTNYITRCYQALLLRSPQPSEVAFYLARLQTYNGQGGQQLSWLAMLNGFYASTEYKDKRCQSSYYTLNGPVAMGALLLKDIWNGSATLQTPSSGSTPITLTIPSATPIWDQKLPIILDPAVSEPNVSVPFKMHHGPRHNSGNRTNHRAASAATSRRYISFTRAFNGQSFTIVLLESYDAGLSFTEVEPLWPIVSGYDYYDAQLSVDNSVCPPMYTLAMECATPQSSGAASLCVSQSPTPGLAYTWSLPTVVVNGCTRGDNPPSCGTQAAESASTGVILMDAGGSKKYLAWTQVYDGVTNNDPLSHTYSQMAGPVASVRTRFGTVMSPGVLPMLTAEAHPWCTDTWDCNNQDKQDWKKEGDYYYALYNGANYYRCNGAWGINIARSATADASGVYTRFTGEGNRPMIPAALNNTCGISYPVLNVIEGELFVYFAYRYASGAPVMMRSRIVRT
jgi:hypothetical protein